MEIDIDETKKDIESSLGISDERGDEIVTMIIKLTDNRQFNSADVKELLRNAENINEALLFMFTLGSTAVIRNMK